MLYLHSPIRLHGTVLSWNMGSTLLLPGNSTDWNSAAYDVTTKLTWTNKNLMCSHGHTVSGINVRWLWAGRLGFDSQSSPSRPDWLWDPLTLLLLGYWGENGWGVKPAPSLHLVPRYMRVELYLQSPTTSSWRRTLLRTGTTLPFLSHTDCQLRVKRLLHFGPIHATNDYDVIHIATSKACTSL
jgi:hypothetical protein